MKHSQTVVLDNGAYSIKVKHISQNKRSFEIPNCCTRLRDEHRYVIGSQLNNVRDQSSSTYLRPIEKGFLTSWSLQKSIWDDTFENVLALDPSSSQLILTENCQNLDSIRESTDQIVMEEYGFESYWRAAPSIMIAERFRLNDFKDENQPLAESYLHVDCGYSSTTIIPVVNGKMITNAIRHLRIGGKFLTNCLKELISFKYYNVMDETHMINQLKEASFFVATDFELELENWHKAKMSQSHYRNTLRYLLPDHDTTHDGRIIDSSVNCKVEDQVLVLTNERFAIPEYLFHPQDIGLSQAGLAELICQAIDACDTNERPILWSNIILTGGTSRIPGLKERLVSECTKLVSNDVSSLHIYHPIDPISFVAECGMHLAQSEDSVLSQQIITRSEYLEYGTSICARKWTYSQ